MALSRVCTTKRVVAAPSLTILVMLPHVPSNGAPPFFLFLVFLLFFIFLMIFSARFVVNGRRWNVGGGEHLHMVLPRVA